MYLESYLRVYHTVQINDKLVFFLFSQYADSLLFTTSFNAFINQYIGSKEQFNAVKISMLIYEMKEILMF